MNISPIQIVVDYRESALISILKNALNTGAGTGTETQTFSTANLEIGDIHIISTIADKQFVLVFERKSLADLTASIKDHRYSEQKARILSTHMPHMCTYIIEGTHYGEPNTSSVEGALIHTMYRDKMHVVCTNGVKETAQFILTVATKCKCHPEYFAQRVGASVGADMGGGGTGAGTGTGTGTGAAHSEPYVSLLKHKTRKIANIDKETCYIMQLCQIPGISHIIATEISSKYPSMNAFLSSLHACESQDDKIKMLKSINNIAEKKAKSIIEFMC